MQDPVALGTSPHSTHQRAARMTPVSKGAAFAREPLTRQSLPGLVKVKCCGLCGMEFMEANLPGVVSFQAIAKLRKKWNAPLPEDSAKLRSGVLMLEHLSTLVRVRMSAYRGFDSLPVPQIRPNTRRSNCAPSATSSSTTRLDGESRHLHKKSHALRYTLAVYKDTTERTFSPPEGRRGIISHSPYEGWVRKPSRTATQPEAKVRVHSLLASVEDMCHLQRTCDGYLKSVGL